MKDKVQDKLLEWFEGGMKTLLGDVAEFADSFYPIFVITCLMGVYVSMMGDKSKGSRMSSMSFLSYIIIKVLANAYK